MPNARARLEPDHEHHDGADDRENNLRLNHRRLPGRRAFASRPEGQHEREPGGDRQTGEGVFEIADLFGERRRALEHVGAFAFLVGLFDVVGLRWNNLRQRRQGQSGHQRRRDKKTTHARHSSSIPT